VTNTQSPILVVGAGTTGLTMACELARHGAPLRIVDKLPGIAPYARATGIHSRTLEIFQQLGILDEVLARGQKILAMKLYANGKQLQHVRFTDVDSPYPFTVGLEQWRTEELLESALKRLGIEVERETELIDLSDRLDGVQARLRHADGSEESVATPWLVACDGAHSRVRHLNRQRFPGEADPRQYVIGDVVVGPPIAHDEFSIHMSERGALMMFPLPEGRNLVLGDVALHHDGHKETPALEELQALVDERTSGALRLGDLRLGDPRWLSYFRIHYRVSRHYAHGRTLLAGDAVHVHSPVGGQGMNTGIQDAYNLAWKLALVVSGRAPHSLLESYEKERRAVAEDVVATTRAATERVEGFRDLSDAERERFVLHLQVPEPDRTAMAEHREELDLDYRRSPICSQHRARALAGTPESEGPHAGAQARDAGPLRVGDRETTLFEAMAGTRHTLLLFVGSPSQAEPRARLEALATQIDHAHGDRIDVCLVDTEDGTGHEPPGVTRIHDVQQALHRRYDAVGECLYLIRPDGYVGFRCEPVELAALRAYLDRFFVPSLSSGSSP
jgi:2-polyprenyl-6-methoxyphenol hydroxylase-like FAD-dependent oxidoreductase